MTEKFLHYLWKMKLLDLDKLFTHTGEKVQIISCGDHNHDSGPDFLNAKIKIGKTLWAGNVEIHVKASEWFQHAHHNDAAYNNIILHAVYENDIEILREDKSEIPCLELKGKFDSEIYSTYQRLMGSASWIPCENQLPKVSNFTIKQWIHRLLIERLEEKTNPIAQSLEQNAFNWEESFYQFLALSLGTKVNGEPFNLLARSLPVKILAKHKNSLMQLEALLFGTAGFLDENFVDDYPNQLKKEFEFLKKKHDLKPMKKHVWKFLRLRPANFPTVRLAQFAQLIFKSTHLFSKILETENLKTLIDFFEVSPSVYWQTHYRFDKISASKNKAIGKDAIELIMINMIAPFFFVYGKLRDEDAFIQRALSLLDKIPAEKNNIIAHWKKSGIEVTSAFDSQSLLQLKNNYCKNFRCLECAIGHKIFLAPVKK